MKHPIFDILAKAGIELKPGEVYWFRSPDDHYSYSAAEVYRYMHPFGDVSANGIEYQFVDKIAPVPELIDKVVGRRMNLGSLGKYHLMMDDSSDMKELIYRLSDLSSLDDRELVDLSRPRYPYSRYSRESSIGDLGPHYSNSLPLWDEEEPEEESTRMFDSAPSPSAPSAECCRSIRPKYQEDLEEDMEEWGPSKAIREEPPLLSFAMPSSKMSRNYNKRPSRKKADTETEDVKDRQEVEALEKAKEELVQRLTAVIVDYVNTTHQMPPMEEIYSLIKGKVVLTPTGLSRLVVNDQLKIFLPDYNELEVSFRPLPMTIYILFLRHLEGIVLNYIGDYARELEEIYSIVMPNRDERSAIKSIQSLTDTLSGSLNQKIAIIKRTFKANILNDEMAAKYYISGSRGDAYRVSLPKELIQLPAVFH